MILSLPLIIALFAVAWLTAGGMAVRSVSRIWLRHWAEQRLRGSAAAATYLERPHRLLAGAGSGVALTLLISGMLIGVAGYGMEIFWGSVIFAGLIVLFAQLLPRAVARRWPTQVAAVSLPVLRLAQLLTVPFALLGRAVAHRFVPAPDESHVDEERDDIQDLLREGELEGVGEREEIAIISGVVEFSEKIVSEVMTPRAEIFALTEGLDALALAKEIAQSGYSRVPIYRETVDNVVGMVHAFDVIKVRGEPVERLRPVSFAAPNASCSELLFRMLRERVHLSIVRNESGHTVGLVTLEDLLEELVGDIRDEHDEPGPTAAT